MTERFTPAAVPAWRASAPRGARRAGSTRLIVAALAAFLAVLGTAMVSSVAVGQEAADGDEVRIVARKLASGGIEVGLQQRRSDDSWSDRQLPEARYVPSTAEIRDWLASSPLTLSIAVAGDVEVRIVARKLANGRTETGLQQHRSDDSWSDRQLPEARYVPTTAEVGQWLASSPITLTAAQPAEGFSAVTAGGWFHSCGLRTDGTITCWYSLDDKPAEAPDGQFSAVSAGDRHSCGVRTDGTVTCWGDNRRGQTDAPHGQFIAVAAGYYHSCGVRTDGTITCWGDTRPWTDPPTGQFTAITVGDGRSCGLRTDGTVTCWGYSWAEQTDPPLWRFAAVAAGSLHSCGLRTDGTIACWGSDWDGQADPPDGQFSAVAADEEYSCGVRTDGVIACWVHSTRGLADPPAGRFSAVSAGEHHACGLRTDGTITCWSTAGGPPRDSTVG